MAGCTVSIVKVGGCGWSVKPLLRTADLQMGCLSDDIV